MIQVIKQKYGSFCMGLKVNYHGTFDQYLTGKHRFCETVTIAFNKPFLLKPANLLCNGSRRSMGMENHEEELINEIHQESGIEQETIAFALQSIPRWKSPVKNILMGMDEVLEQDVQPDMYILFINPAETMALMKKYAEKLNQFPVIRPYFFLSVCGSILAGTWHTNKINISFGCPESRKYAGLSENLLVAGIPYRDSLILFE